MYVCRYAPSFTQRQRERITTLCVVVIIIIIVNYFIRSKDSICDYNYGTHSY